MDLEGKTIAHVSEPDVDPPYAYMMTGTGANSFYLAQVYWPDQSKAQVAKYIQNYADWTTDGYKDGKYLGEFDYCDKSRLDVLHRGSHDRQSLLPRRWRCGLETV